VNVLSRAESVVITHRDWKADGYIPVAALDRAVESIFDRLIAESLVVVGWVLWQGECAHQ